MKDVENAQRHTIVAHGRLTMQEHRLKADPNNIAAQIMLGKLDPATLKLCEVAMDRARQAAENLLKRGMFRNGGYWSETMSELLDTRRWLSHAQMISWEGAQDPQIGLMVEYHAYHSQEWQDYWRESPRVCRRLHFLRGLSNEQIQKIFPGNPGTCSTHGV